MLLRLEEDGVLNVDSEILSVITAAEMEILNAVCKSIMEKVRERRASLERARIETNGSGNRPQVWQGENQPGNAL